MKKLAIALAAFGALAIATPVFACPGHDGDKSDAPKTAEKSEPKEKAPAKKKDTKKNEKKDTAKDDKKDGDKVSLK